MNTFVAWVLIITSYGGYGGTSPTIAVVDNISSAQQCQAVARAYRARDPYYSSTLCVSVRKGR